MDIEANFLKNFTEFFNETLSNPLLCYGTIGLFILVCLSLTLLLKMTSRLIRELSNQRHKSITNFRYNLLGTLFSGVEHRFFLILKESLSDQYEIFAKVLIADVLTPEQGLSQTDWNNASTRISSRHFDFVLCDKKTLLIIAAIELHDSHYYLSKRHSGDSFIQKACETAGLKYIHFEYRQAYSVNAVRNIVMESLNTSTPYSVYTTGKRNIDESPLQAEQVN